jgi:hypothetical protein
MPAPATPQHCTAHGSLPDAACTPGATDATVAAADLCPRPHTASKRPPVSYTENLKRQQIAQYGYEDTDPADYEEDHLIPLELGGDPRDPKNLWPQPRVHPAGQPYDPSQPLGSYEKDEVENALNAAVCNGTFTLPQAQDMIATDWTAAWRTLHPGGH